MSGHGPFPAKEATMDSLLQFFVYEHLPPHLQTVSKPFGDMARELAVTLPANAESTTALRKLLEAKDWAVRAVLFKPTGASESLPAAGSSTL
jgi:hypothetical protein